MPSYIHTTQHTHACTHKSFISIRETPATCLRAAFQQLNSYTHPTYHVDSSMLLEVRDWSELIERWLGVVNHLIADTHTAHVIHAQLVLAGGASLDLVEFASVLQCENRKEMVTPQQKRENNMERVQPNPKLPNEGGGKYTRCTTHPPTHTHTHTHTHVCVHTHMHVCTH
jgi:hypothetical protein